MDVDHQQVEDDPTKCNFPMKVPQQKKPKIVKIKTLPSARKRFKDKKDE